MKMNENIEQKNEEAKRILRITPENYTINNFKYEKLYTDKIQIKNQMEFPLVLNIKSSDLKKMQVAEKIVKLNGQQSVRLTFNIKIKKNIPIGSLYISITNDLIDYKFYITLKSKDKEITDNVVHKGGRLSEIPELTEPVHSELRDSKGYQRSPEKHRQITIEVLSSLREDREEYYEEVDYNKVHEEPVEDREDYYVNMDNMEQMESLANEIQHSEESERNDIRRDRQSRHSPLGKGLSKSVERFNIPKQPSPKGKKSIVLPDNINDDRHANLTHLDEVKQCYVDILYHNYMEHKRRNNDIIAILEDLVSLSNSNISNFNVDSDYKKLENFEKINNNMKRLDSIVNKFIEGLKFYDKHLHNSYVQENLNKKLTSGYVGINFDTLQTELDRLNEYSAEITNLKCEVNRLDMENNYLKTCLNTGNKSSTDNVHRVDVMNNEIDFLKKEGVRKQEIIRAKEELLYKKEDEIRTLQRNYEKLLTEKNLKISKDYVGRSEVASMLADKEKTIIELKENLFHTSGVLQNLKDVVSNKTDQFSKSFVNQSEDHYVRLVETLKHDIRCKDQVIADLCGAEGRRHEALEDMKSFSTTLKNEHLEKTMNSLTEEVEKQKYRNSVNSYFILAL
jgi:hypothetical protein